MYFDGKPLNHPVEWIVVPEHDTNGFPALEEGADQIETHDAGCTCDKDRHPRGSFARQVFLTKSVFCGPNGETINLFILNIVGKSKNGKSPPNGYWDKEFEAAYMFEREITRTSLILFVVFFIAAPTRVAVSEHDDFNPLKLIG